ncbi:PEP-utilizing enzyme [Amycolatopsis nigrescens]|uniref:PEP-utilizing enzyme n=1 Tax=Amycolatopsis nigrescens TaxID=381445 RepID=UPI00035CB914|nr:PEP-utilizing enzyme [Amycolatopsis nigrescens]
MSLPTFSLDTPSTVADAVHSGYNFREVCPELLSPLAWSIIGAGMEQGFRAAARKFAREQPSGPRPRFVSYFGFRPYFNMTTTERLIDELRVIDPAGIWDLLLGGPGPEIARRPKASKTRAALRLPRTLRLVFDNADAFGTAHTALAKAEAGVLAAVETGSSWQAGTACDAAIEAGREAWALHIRTTTVAYAAAALTRRLLRIQYNDATALELLRASAHRKDDGQGASSRAGALTIDLDRLNNYEVADASELFGRFSNAGLSAAASLLGNREKASGEIVADEASVPLGTALGPVYEQAVKMLGLALGERERSKEIGLRALHCTRVLLDMGAFSAKPDEAALLGVTELRELGPTARRRLTDQRREELEEAAATEYPVDLQQRRRGLAEAVRPAPSGLAGAGNALAPGWAEGTLVRESDGEEGRIVVGDRVDGNYVLAVLPDGVVSRYGSVLSHVAIVCRELGIPFVAGLSIPDDQIGQSAVVDGWNGTVSVGDAI